MKLFPTKQSMCLGLALLALTLPASAQLSSHPATAEDARPNDPKVPDSYALSAKFDRILVLRAKNKTDLLTEMEKQVKAQNIKNAVILSGIGSVRGYRLHNVTGRDYPVPDMFFSAPTTPADFIGMNGYIVNGVIHAHVTLALGDNKGTTVSGHLEKGTEVLTFAIVTVGVLDTDLGRVDDATYR
ncbi:MAG TPA: PPC domain-containing DNA-binding protein [Rhizomicrobium sp.]|nr:PPC domain-containing DNA-binding protein [Rhizomicrobium sp.]